MMSNVDAHVYLVRNAEAIATKNPHIIDGRTNESPLTTTGVDQAKRLGSFMLGASLKPEYAYTSPAIRSMQTASISLVLAAVPIWPFIQDNLQELDQGEWTGLDRITVYTPEVQAQIAKHGKDFKAPGGESMNEAGERMKQALDDIAEECIDAKTDDSAPVIFVYTHSVAIRSLISIVHDWPHERTFRTAVPNASLTHVTQTEGQWNLEHLGRKTS